MLFVMPTIDHGHEVGGKFDAEVRTRSCSCLPSLHQKKKERDMIFGFVSNDNAFDLLTFRGNICFPIQVLLT